MTLYTVGRKDVFSMFFYLLICIVIHAVVQEYVLDVSICFTAWQGMVLCVCVCVCACVRACVRVCKMGCSVCVDGWVYCEC